MPPPWPSTPTPRCGRASSTSSCTEGPSRARSRSSRVTVGARTCLREAELWSTAALVAGRAAYPYDELEEIWRDVLLNQFHDILPGSSIAMVNDEAMASYAKSAAAARGHHRQSHFRLCAARATCPCRSMPPPTPVTASPPCRPVVAGAVPPGPWRAGAGGGHRPRKRPDPGGTRQQRAHCLSAATWWPGERSSRPGHVGNVLQLHPDFPNKWPAWDVDAFYRNAHQDLESPESITVLSRAARGGRHPDRVSLRRVPGRPNLAAGRRQPRAGGGDRGGLARARTTAKGRSPDRRPRRPVVIGDPVRPRANDPPIPTRRGTTPASSSSPTALCTWARPATAWP